ncbi:MAG: MFS transporter [Bacteriovoracaceae bacterium]
MSVFKKTLPLTFTVFINKCGTIGLNLIPMLLVEKHLRGRQSAIIMTTIKVVAVSGSFLGSYLCDFLGMKMTLLLSFFLAGIGLGGLPLFDSVMALTLFACIAQMGHSMFGGPMRLLISDVVDKEEQQVAWGWFRTANNLGQVVAFSIGSLFAGFGISMLMFFDATTSILATVVGTKIIKSKKIEEEEFAEKNLTHLNKTMKTFLMFALVTGGFACMYELFVVAVAANCRIYFGEEGVSIFSKILLVNTIFCTLVALPASKKIKNPRLAFPLGILFMALGSALSFYEKDHLPMLFVGMFLVSLGEIFYTALSTYVLIRITPKMKKKGTIFGIGLIFQPVGRILGAGIAFPLVVYGKHGMILPLILGLIVLSMAFAILPDIMKVLKEERHSLS